MPSISTDLDIMLGENLRILSQALGNICRRSPLQEASGGDITENQLSILRMLRRRDHLTASELARILSLSNAAITKIIDRHDEIAARKLAAILADFDTADKEQLLGFIRRIVQGTRATEQDVDLICYPCGGRFGDSCVVQRRRGSCSLKPDEGD